MIAAALRSRLRARPVGDAGQLASGWYVYLEYSQGDPYAVRLVQPGPYPVEVTFARDILRSALRGDPDGLGEVRARLEFVPQARHSMVLITLNIPDYQGVLALDDKAVAGFLCDTEDRVPSGTESEFLDLDAELAGILGNAA